ncbi:uncharacterized protein LOC107360936 [Tetranychus urticae]|uniref:URB1 C-terminal domain-containing protein n=1 Tax=Tetranychus urticae TaxID=32264 RepID=T1K7L1_TETUR|nr:uncharacterized protein LOC107360936 [Tetranychus urticae]
MNRFNSLISAYGATLSTKDVEILQELFSLDASASLLKFNPFIWGESAPLYYSTIADTRFTLFKMPKSSHVLGQYRKGKMMKTLKEFPVDLPLDPSVEYEDRPDLYDPRFILFTLYHLLGPENAINSNQIIKLNGLSIALMTTSSENASMRNLGYLVLERFFYHLEGSKSSSAIYFWVHFIDCYRSSLNSTNQQVPFLLNSLLIEIIEIVDTPKDSLFYAIKDFVTAKPKLDSYQITLLFKNLLTTKDLEWKKCQKLVLNLLSRCIKSDEDFEICKTNDLCRYILSIYSSNWCDLNDKICILKFIKSCIRLPKVAKVFLIEYGLTVWLTNIVASLDSKDPSEQDELKDLVKILQKSCRNTDLPKNCYKQQLKMLKVWVKFSESSSVTS